MVEGTAAGTAAAEVSAAGTAAAVTAAWRGAEGREGAETAAGCLACPSALVEEAWAADALAATREVGSEAAATWAARAVSTAEAVARSVAGLVAEEAVTAPVDLRAVTAAAERTWAPVRLLRFHCLHCSLREKTLLRLQSSAIQSSGRRRKRGTKLERCYFVVSLWDIELERSQGATVGRGACEAAFVHHATPPNPT